MDSSSIVRLYVDEPGSGETRSALGRAEGVTTSIVAYVEVLAAFARLSRARSITRNVHLRATAAFDAGWQDFYALEVGEGIARFAGSLTNKHALTAFDAIHLASALAIRDNSPDSVDFATADTRLRSAAIIEGFVVV